MEVGARERSPARSARYAWLLLLVGCGASSSAEPAEPRNVASATNLAGSVTTDGSAGPAPRREPLAPGAAPPSAEPSAQAAAPVRPSVTAVEAYEKILQKPDSKAPLIGLIRAGQSVPLAKPERLEGPGVGHCKGGWYAVEPRGYVCVGANSTLDADDPRAVAARATLPDPSRPLPFQSGVGIALGSPQYKRIPTKAEQRAREPGLDAHLAKLPPSDATGVVDASRAGRGPSKALLRYLETTKLPLVSERDAYEGRKMAFVDEFDAEGRTFLVTPDRSFVPKDKVRRAKVPQLVGIDLRERKDLRLPIAYTWIEDTPKLARRQDGSFVETGELWPRQSFVGIEGQLVMGKGGPYWKTSEGAYVRNDLVTHFKKRGGRPAGVGPKDKWIQVRITWGTLVAYEGDEPVYVTAISPGQDGVTERAHGHTTKRGTYSVGWKLISADMAGVEKTKPWAVDEVPFVAYYKDSYALHGAWWHDDFGRPKSHGCVNLAPRDAQWLWRWMEPGLPEGWYAVAAYYPEVKGTTVHITQ